MARKNLFRDIAGVFSSNVFALINALVVSIILTRVLGPEGFGIYSAIIVIPMVVIALSQLGIRASAIYHIGHDKENIDKNISGIMMLLLMTSLVGIILASLAFLITDTQDYSLLMMLLAVLFIPMHLTSLFTGGVFLGKEEIARANFIRWFPVLMDLIFVLIFVVLLQWRIEGALLAIFSGYFVIAIWSLLTLSRDHIIRPHFLKPVIIPLVRMGIVFALAVFIIQLNYRIDVLILKSLKGPEEVGFYALGVSIAEALWQLPLAVGIVVMSRTANTTDHRLMNETTARLLRLSLIVGVLAAIILFWLAPWIIPFIWTEDFMPSAEILRFILPGILFMSVFRIISSRLSGMGKPQIAIYVFLPSLLLNVILNYWWIPEHGSMGAVMATNVSYIIGALVFLWVYARIVDMPLARIFTYHKSDFNFIGNLLKRKKKDEQG
ncbi:MAG: flippase [Bacteroidota bacterium]|nr:flippase [Bacteroidota bacterium]